MLLHDGEGDVEGSQRVAEEALRQQQRLRGGADVEEEQGVLGLDALVHLRHLLHRARTIIISHRHRRRRRTASKQRKPVNLIVAGRPIDIELA